MTHFIMTATHGSFRAVIYLGCVDTFALHSLAKGG